jgi:protein-disulfide isomerase
VVYKRGGVMAVLLTAIFVIAGSLSIAAGQGKFVSVDDDPVLGKANAKVTIIEFGDYQCPVCRMFWREIEPRLKKQYVDTGKVKLVFRDFPIQQIHPESTMAAMAAQCAADQGKYWEYHDKIFREQDRGTDDLVRFKAADLKKWATDIRLDAAAFSECVDSGRYKDEVAKDFADGAAVGVQGTPMFFINGRVVAGAQPFPVFKKIIDEELAR